MRVTGSSQPLKAIAPVYGELDEAHLAMREGRASDAIALLDALSAREPTDATIVRRLAVAHAANGDIQGAARIMARAYELNFGLCSSPMSATSFGLSATRWRRLVVDAVSLGHDCDQPEVWFFVATLMQAEERSAPAKRMLDRAVASGLDGELGRRMKSAL